MATQQSKPRTWKIWAEDFPTEEDFIAAVEAEVVRCVWIAHRLGRQILYTPIRVEQVQGDYATVGFLFRDSFVPAAPTKHEPIEPGHNLDLDALESEPEPVEA